MPWYKHDRLDPVDVEDEAGVGLITPGLSETPNKGATIMDLKVIPERCSNYLMSLGLAPHRLMLWQTTFISSHALVSRWDLRRISVLHSRHLTDLYAAILNDRLRQ